MTINATCFVCLWLILCASSRVEALSWSTVRLRTQELAKSARRALSASFYPETTGAKSESSALFNAGKVAGTDKVSFHNYEVIYSKAFESTPQRDNVQRLFEIGLGCNMGYGPGKSAQMWRAYFPNATIWMADVDEPCVVAKKAELDAMRINAVLGDQANITTLKRWVQETGGNFDVIVDDGSHENAQMYHSFVVLFTLALKPGGIYIIEDMGFDEYFPPFPHRRGPLRMTDVVASWITTLVRHPADRYHRDNERKFEPMWPLVPHIRSIECIRGACSFIKCHASDHKCNHPAFDAKFVEDEVNLG